MTDTVAHTSLSQRTGLEVLDIPSTSCAVVDVYDVDMDGEGDCKILDIPPSVEGDTRLNLRADFSAFQEKYVQHLVEAQKTGLGDSS